VKSGYREWGLGGSHTQELSLLRDCEIIVRRGLKDQRGA